jgi:hypothetical protein
MGRQRLLVLLLFVATVSPGLAPAVVAGVEMEVDPNSIYIPPGGEVEFTLTITSHDPVSHRCRLALELWTPDGRTVRYQDREFTLDPHQIISCDVSRTAPYGAPLGVYQLWFNLYDRDTGQQLATSRLGILIG